MLRITHHKFIPIIVQYSHISSAIKTKYVTISIYYLENNVGEKKMRKRKNVDDIKKIKIKNDSEIIFNNYGAY
jgi:hypothetical protein